MKFFNDFKNSITMPKKPVVFMQHGLLASADSWIMNEDSLGPAFLLANQGYDVWLGNQRGTKYSRKHEWLNPDKCEDLSFWDFSFPEIGKIDAPAQIDYILKITGHEKISYVGHSQWSTQMFYGLATNEEYFKDRVNVFIALAPAVKITNAKATYIQMLAKFEHIITGLADNLKIKEVYGKGWEV